MSTNIYTREECKKLIDELGIISYKKIIKIQESKITPLLMESILYHTPKCNNRLSERTYWILNDIEDYPFCQECGKQFKPRFYGLKNAYHGGIFCSSKCSSSNIEVQEKLKQTNFKKRGVEYSFQSEVVKDKCKQTMVINHGCENPSQSEEIKLKKKQTCLKRYNVEHPSQCKEIKQKKINTCLKNYNVENPQQSPIIKEKTKQTMLDRHGCENPSQSEKIKQKKIDNCLKNHGVEYSWQTEQTKNKSKETCLKNHGVEYSLQSPLIREKGKQTCIEKYDVPYAMQNKDIFKKSQQNSLKLKELILPSGKQITYQGYENMAILKLLEDGYLEEQIITETNLIPSFSYLFEDKNKTYYPDIFIPHENKIIEVKSIYTYSSNLEINLIKRQACLDAGYLFEFWICSDREVLEIR